MKFRHHATLCFFALTLPATSFAGSRSDPWPGDSATGDADSGVRMSVNLEFGGTRRGSNGLGFAVDYDRRGLAPGVAAVPLLRARLADGTWQSVMLAGVDVIHLKQRLNATGDSGNDWVPWAIGGVVAAGATAIIVHYATNKETPQSDLRGLPTK